jgi:hypothetical protein
MRTLAVLCVFAGLGCNSLYDLGPTEVAVEDIDGDGVENATDNCPTIGNAVLASARDAHQHPCKPEPERDLRRRCKLR